MKTKYKHIYFKKIPPEKGLWYCFNNSTGIGLGCISWYAPWHQRVFEPAPNIQAVFSDDCLKDIVDFMRQLREERR
jgi:hypothetical protein